MAYKISERSHVKLNEASNHANKERRTIMY